MKIRSATINDLCAIVKIGNQCFPPEEAATEGEFEERLRVHPNQFWLLEEGECLVGFINGMATNKEKITDEMFKNPHLHCDSGLWQAIFGVNTDPQYRKKGYAAQMMERVIIDAKQQGRKGCILTCKEGLIDYYKKFGYECQGISQSKLAGAVWYDMCLRF